MDFQRARFLANEYLYRQLEVLNNRVIAGEHVTMGEKMIALNSLDGKVKALMAGEVSAEEIADLELQVTVNLVKARTANENVSVH
jgi:hypothetical protein